MKYGIAIFPTKKLQDLANSFRKRYDTHYALIPPHVTLKNSFEIDESDMKSVTDELAAIAKETAPIPLNIYKVSSFAPVNNVIYLKVDPTDELIQFHEKLHSGSGYFQDNREYAYVPHITIGQNLSDDEHSDVLGTLKMTNIEHEEMADRFHLLYQLEDGMWTVYETFRFGKDA
ncbi:2',5' RNA ligase family [Bacillus sp. THAF10]|uniref:YjcG family protein n=1 Tax=Bacillus sp. THAF10 TaxID=2587848 RepID=UPI0012678A64|nr:YjcG family protein [Bacillus sp. THAF10]QFT88446.1 2',5' RNA ligase family [Bacillus sp. THAF10]